MDSPNQRQYDVSDKDVIYDLLSNHRRRYTIHYLKQIDDETTLSELAEQVAAWEQEKEIQELTSDERKRVYTSLQQTHLPKLAEAEMITFERDSIALAEGAEDLEIYLDIVPSSSIPWGLYYLGLSIVSAGILAAVGLGIIPDEPVPPIIWAGLIVLAFLGSAIGHTINNRRYRLGSEELPP